MTRLQDLATRWTKDSASRDELLDLIVREQFLSILPEDVRVSVIERQPKNGEEASQFAENYLQARSTSITPKQAKVPTTKCPRCGRHGHWARDWPRPRNVEGRDANATTGDSNQRRNPNSRPLNMDGVRCYNCNEKGHISSNCPKRSLYCGQSGTGIQGQDKARRHGTVNGVYCPDILVDTGATQTLVRKELVADDDILDGEVTICCAHGDTASYPLAVVKINIGGKDIITTAAVSGTLPASVLLGWDVPELMNFATDGPERSGEDALAVMTKLRSRRPQEPGDQSEMDVQAAPSSIETPTAPEPETEFLSNFDDSLFFPTGVQQPILTRAQKREDRRRFRRDHNSTGSRLNISAEELQVLQNEDGSLQRAREIAEGTPSTTAGEKYFRRDGLIYRLYSPTGSVDDDARAIEQLVLPTPCRQTVLELAHDIPMAGHLGRKKTVDRVLQRFYWPGVFRDVEDHCRTCEQCQKT